MYQRLLTLSILLLAFASCSETKKESQHEPSYSKIKKADWLLGNWHHSSTEGDATEKWSSGNDSIYTAESFITVKNDTVFYETVSLEQRDSSLYYIVSAKGQNTGGSVSFKLTSDSDTTLVFENPDHDFPKKITYNRIGDDSLFAEISGEVNGKERSEGFPFKKSH